MPIRAAFQCFMIGLIVGIVLMAIVATTLHFVER